MSDVQVTIGGDQTPFQATLNEVRRQATLTGRTISDSLGVEGVKGERALHGRLTALFKDIKDARNPVAALGDALQNIGESFRLSLGSTVLFVAIAATVESIYHGVEAALKMRDAVKDALSINATDTEKSVERVRDEVDRLKKDAADNNLAAMNWWNAAWTTFIQAMAEGKKMGEVTVEDAKNFHDEMELARKEQDANSAKQIENENAVLKLKLDGHEKEAAALEREQSIHEKIIEAQEKGETRTVQLLKDQLKLENGLTQAEEARATAKKEEEDRERRIADLRRQLSEQEKRDSEKNLSPEEVVKESQSQIQSALAKKADADHNENLEELLQSRLDLETAISRQKEAQGEIDKRNVEKFLRGNELDGKLKESRDEKLSREKDLEDEQADQEKENRFLNAQSRLFNGAVSSTVRLGLGGRVGQSNHAEISGRIDKGNQTLLKIHTVLDQIKHALGHTI